VLEAALAAILALKLFKFNEENPAMIFIGRCYTRARNASVSRHAGAVVARAREWGVLQVVQSCRARGSSGIDAG